MAPTTQLDAPTRTISLFSPGWWPCAILVVELGRGHALITMTKIWTSRRSRVQHGKAGLSRLVKLHTGTEPTGLCVPRRSTRGRGAGTLGAASIALKRCTAARPALYLLLRLHLDVAALDVATPGVAVVGAADEFDGEAVSGDLCL